MPIYAYRCATCGHARDVLQKISDPLLAVCPACGASTFVKQVTAAGFQLKGSGWYVTDFRGDGKSGKPAGDAEGGAVKEGEAANGAAPGKTDEAKKPGDGTPAADAKPAGEGARKAEPSAAAPAPAAPPASAPAPGAAAAPASGKSES